MSTKSWSKGAGRSCNAIVVRHRLVIFMQTISSKHISRFENLYIPSMYWIVSFEFLHTSQFWEKMWNLRFEAPVQRSGTQPQAAEFKSTNKFVFNDLTSFHFRKFEFLFDFWVLSLTQTFEFWTLGGKRGRSPLPQDGNPGSKESRIKCKVKYKYHWLWNSPLVLCLWKSKLFSLRLRYLIGKIWFSEWFSRPW